MDYAYFGFLRYVSNSNHTHDFIISDVQLYAQHVCDQVSFIFLQLRGNKVNQKCYHFGQACCRPADNSRDATQFYMLSSATHLQNTSFPFASQNQASKHCYIMHVTDKVVIITYAKKK